MKRHPAVYVVAAIAVWLALNSALAAAPRDAVVKVGNGCSGVCVSPDGLILTVKHCEIGETCDVVFPGHPAVKGRRVYVGENAEDVVAVDVEGDEWPFIPVASSAPAAGEGISSAGYPFGTFRDCEGSVTGYGTIGGSRVFWTSVPVNLGWSGGPATNARHEVVGVLSSKPTPGEVWGPGVFVGHDRLVKAVEFCQLPKQSLYVYGVPGCGGCEAFKRDWRAGKFAQYDVIYRDIYTDLSFSKKTVHYAEYAKLVAALEKATGKRQSRAVPAFHVAGRAALTVGYSSRTGVRDLVDWMRSTLRLPLTTFDFLTGQRDGGETPIPAEPPGVDLGDEQEFPVVEVQPDPTVLDKLGRVVDGLSAVSKKVDDVEGTVGSQAGSILGEFDKVRRGLEQVQEVVQIASDVKDAVEEAKAQQPEDAPFSWWRFAMAAAPVLLTRLGYKGVIKGSVA